MFFKLKYFIFCQYKGFQQYRNLLCLNCHTYISVTRLVLKHDKNKPVTHNSVWFSSFLTSLLLVWAKRKWLSWSATLRKALTCSLLSGSKKPGQIKIESGRFFSLNKFQVNISHISNTRVRKPMNRLMPIWIRNLIMSKITKIKECYLPKVPESTGCKLWAL